MRSPGALGVAIGQQITPGFFEKGGRLMSDLEILAKVYAALGDGVEQEKLDRLSFAWLCVASNVRTQALIAPGGFPAERDRQAAQLRTMADTIAVDQPDLEMERFVQEGDFEGLMGHLQRRLRENNEKGGA